MPSTGRRKKAKFPILEIFGENVESKVRRASIRNLVGKRGVAVMGAERSQRPGGVTTLAIINFVEFAISLLGVLGLVFVYFRGAAVQSGLSGNTGLLILLAFNGVISVLMFLSGIGLLGCRKIIGRHLTSLLFLVSLAKSVWVVNAESKQFDLMLVALVVWPLIAAVLVNTVFKDDLVR